MTYATAEAYRTRNSSASARDDLVEDVIEAASRYTDDRLGWCPGGLAPIVESEVEFFPYRPNRVLRLRDAAGHAWPIRTITEVTADYDGDGMSSWTATAATDWLVIEPRPTTTTAGRGLRILETRSDASEGSWPSDPGTVRVNGTWGLPVTPPAVREFVIHIARMMLDSHSGGAATVMGALDGSGVDFAKSSETGRLWRMVEQRYSAGRPARLGVVGSRALRGWR